MVYIALIGISALQLLHQEGTLLTTFSEMLLMQTAVMASLFIRNLSCTL